MKVIGTPGGEDVEEELLTSGLVSGVQEILPRYPLATHVPLPACPCSQGTSPLPASVTPLVAG